MRYSSVLAGLLAGWVVLHPVAGHGKAFDYAQSGGRFYASCQANRATCEHVVGVLSRTRQSAQRSGLIPPRYCPPWRVDVGALTDIVLIYISGMPGRSDRPFAAIAGEAFDSRYPCERSATRIELRLAPGY